MASMTFAKTRALIQNRFMKRVITLGIFAFILLLTSVGLYFGLQALNQKRIKLANYYTKSANQANDQNEKILFLIKADAINPNNAQKLQIAELFLTQNQPKKAEYYLYLTPNEQGNALLAQYYILNDPKNAQNNINKIKDARIINELNQILDIQSGKNLGSATVDNPQTPLAKLVSAINTQDYSKLESQPLLTELSESIPKDQNTNTQTLALVNYFLSKNMPNLAIFTLNALDGTTGETVVSDETMAKAYAQKSDFKSAVANVTKAIKLAPENTVLYTEGIVWAKNVGNNAQADFWTQRLNELNNLQK